MRRFLLISTIALALISVAHADLLNPSYTVHPGDLADGLTFLNGYGSAAFGYDPDMGPPEGSVAGGSAPGYGSSAFYSNVDGSLVTPGVRDYTSFRISPKNVFGMSDLLEVRHLFDIRYWTNYVSGVDWKIKIYTESTSGNDWFGHRIQLEFPDGVADGIGDWDQYNMQSSSPGTTLNVDWITTGKQTPAGSRSEDYTVRSWTDVQDMFPLEKIMFIDIVASYATSSPPSLSYLDGVEIETHSEVNIAKINLESAVPAPGAALLALIGLPVIGWVKRRFA